MPIPKMAVCVLDRRTPEAVRCYLKDKGIQVVLTKEVTPLESPLNTHTDIQLAKVGEQLICEPSLYEYYREIFPLVKPGQTHLCPEYPKDAAYNCLSVGDYLFHRQDVTDPVILQTAKEQGIKTVPVKQGYAACSTLVVSDNAVITADDGMEAALLQRGTEVLKLSPGGILLKNYPYGFIGGAGGRILDNEILFFGTPRDERIISFLIKHQKKPVCFPGIPEDFGGLVFLDENR